MTDFSDDELPEVAISALSQPSSSATEVKEKPKQSAKKKFNLAEELDRRHREHETGNLEYEKCLNIDKELIEENEEEDQLDRECKAVLKRLPPIKEIPEEAPGRKFFFSKYAFSSFRAETLNVPHRIRAFAKGKPFVVVKDIRSVLQESSIEDSNEILRYVFLLVSVHEDELAIQHYLDLLLEFSGTWYIGHQLLLAAFANWGADISQVLPNYTSHTKGNINGNELVPAANVEAILLVVAAQVRARKKINEYNLSDDGWGLWDTDELVFGLLILLSLDKNYMNCCRRVQESVSTLLTAVKDRNKDPLLGYVDVCGDWAETYCLLITQLETDFYNLTTVVGQVLIGSVACEDLQLCLCFVAIQRLLGVRSQNVDFSFEINKLSVLIQENLNRAVSQTPTNLYCLLIFLDTILRHSNVIDKVNFKEFLSWLNRLERKIHSSSSHVYAQITSYQTLWEDLESQPLSFGSRCTQR